MKVVSVYLKSGQSRNFYYAGDEAFLLVASIQDAIDNQSDDKALNIQDEFSANAVLHIGSIAGVTMVDAARSIQADLEIVLIRQRIEKEAAARSFAMPGMQPAIDWRNCLRIRNPLQIPDSSFMIIKLAIHCITYRRYIPLNHGYIGDLVRNPTK